MPRVAPKLVGVVSMAVAMGAAPAFATTPGDAQPAPPPSEVTPTSVERIAGDDRYGTAAEIAAQWSGTPGRVYIVSGHNFPDALVAAARAGSFDAPVLLAKPGHLPVDTIEALQRLQPREIVVVGGEESISESVLEDLAQYAGRDGVERIVGSNRYETSAQLASQYSEGRDRIFLASGADYPDALSAAAVAAFEGEPLLLTRPESLPSAVADQLERLKPKEIVVVGGPSAVSEGVAGEAADYAASGVANRIYGEDRYQTSAAVAEEFSPNARLSYVASGQDYADALVVSALAALDAAPVVITPTNRLAQGTLSALEHIEPEVIHVAGGPIAVSHAVVKELENLGDRSEIAPKDGMLLGGNIMKRDAPNGFEEVAEFEESLGSDLSVVNLFHEFSAGVDSKFWFDRKHIEEGRTVMISWRATDNPGSTKGEPDPKRAQKITQGKFDAEIIGMARSLRDLDEPILLRFNWEMDQSPGQNQYIGTPAEFIAAWRYVHGIFNNEGAHNVEWVWAPRAASFNKGVGPTFYPGDAYVDWIGGSAVPINSYRSVEEIYGDWAAWGSGKGKPMLMWLGLRENPSDASWKPGFLNDVKDLTSADDEWGDIRTFVYYHANSPKGHDYWADTTNRSWKAFKSLARADHVVTP